MSKGLEAIEIIRDRFVEYKNKAEGKDIKCLISPQFAQVRKELETLEIIKNKEVDIHLLKACISCFTDALYAYNSEIKKLHSNHKDYQNKPLCFYQLTEEEFELLKEVLE